MKKIENINPVLKKNIIHNSKNVMVKFQSFKIQLIEKNKKFLTPIYVPIIHMEKYLRMNESELNISLLKQIYEQDLNQYIYVDSETQSRHPKRLIGQKFLNHKRVV